MYLLETVPVDNDITGLLIVIGILILFIAFCIFMAVKLSKGNKKARNTLNNKMQAYNASFMAAVNHFNGLPIAEGVLTQLFWCMSKIVFEANGASFNLEMSKITDISVKTDVEIQQQYVSSAGGAVAGGVLFGPIGAMIGGRAKKKEIKQTNSYLIFTYKDDESLKYIAFDCTASWAQARRFVDEFQKIKPSQTQSFDL